MKFKGRNGQAATEYLVILAVVIIIALIVIGVLGGFPSIGRQSNIQASLTSWASAPIGITVNSITATGDGSLRVRNNMPGKIEITDIQIDDNDPPTTSVYAGADIMLEPGEEATFAVTHDCGNQGDAYSPNVEFTFDDEVTGEAALVYQGEVALVGACLG